ncbi:MASE1 domain-containing protein [Kitasatospora aureofaciens]|uniref:MASE1 domain-containing protein n=1 Tax=Kitasatospora aureofaciens TaxID=1894 RepID=UPI001C48C79E|nr:MASE1 domain-containing protein [Kitasatospora aureofaciens]MBV6697710.1 MASE1 domain-containing protein [Kitasatospora aureofaciens]
MTAVPLTTLLRPRDPRHPAVTALRLLAITAVYLAAGRIGLLQQVVVGGAKVTPLWPPTGIALTCLLLFGLSSWPAVALGAYLATITTGPPNWGSLGIMAGNTLAPVAAYLMLRRARFRIELDRLRDGVALVFLGAFAGMLISATIGTTVLVLIGTLPAGGFWSTWSAWWTGDAMGVLVITPLLLALRTARLPTDPGPFDWVEPALLLAGTATVTVVATATTLSLLFLVFPFLIWAALRFQLFGAAPCVLLISVLTIVAATDHAGPFTRHGLVADMVVLQALNGCAALTGLLLSAIIAEQRNTYRRIEQACVELAEVVNRLTPGKADTGRWLPPEDDGR